MDAEMIILCDGVVIPQSKKKKLTVSQLQEDISCGSGRVRNCRIIWEWIGGGGIP